MSDKKTEKMCCYCEFSAPTFNDDEFICEKKGIIDAKYKCRKFVFDPLKITPKAKKELPETEYIEI